MPITDAYSGWVRSNIGTGLLSEEASLGLPGAWQSPAGGKVTLHAHFETWDVDAFLLNSLIPFRLLVTKRLLRFTTTNRALRVLDEDLSLTVVGSSGDARTDPGAVRAAHCLTFFAKRREVGVTARIASSVRHILIMITNRTCRFGDGAISTGVLVGIPVRTGP
jgi:hypothetical protein